MDGKTVVCTAVFNSVFTAHSLRAAILSTLAYGLVCVYSSYMSSESSPSSYELEGLYEHVYANTHSKVWFTGVRSLLNQIGGVVIPVCA
ncbi:hypothetical protein D3C71_1116330 [compost metagenome]